MITFWQIIFSLIVFYFVCVIIHLVKLIFFKDRLAKSLFPANKHRYVKTLIIMGSGLLPLLYFDLFSNNL